MAPIKLKLTVREAEINHAQNPMTSEIRKRRRKLPKLCGNKDLRRKLSGRTVVVDDNGTILRLRQ